MVKLVVDMFRGYELTGLYQETPQLFGVQPSKTFAKFLQALTLHEYLVAQTFFRSLQMQPHTCIPPLPTELPREVDSDSEDEDCVLENSKARHVVDTGIVFQTPSVNPTIPE